MRKTIGVLTSVLDGFYFNSILQGIYQAAAQNQVNVIFIQTVDPDYEHITYERHLADDYIDGWLVITKAVTNPQYIKQLKMRDRPIVSTPYAGGLSPCTVFNLSNEQGGYGAARHLIEHGHRRIACIYSSGNDESVLRYQGYLRALDEFNIPILADLIYDIPDLWEPDALKAFNIMSKKGFNFSALVASSDSVALTILKQLQKQGKRVPEDIALFGFDNIEDARKHSLSTIDQPLFQRGQRMVVKLIEQMEAVTPLLRDQFIMDSTYLVIRQSCGCKERSPVKEDTKRMYLDSLETINYLSRVIQRNHHVGRDIVRSNVERIKNLSWLATTAYTWGCLALWNDQQTLTIESVYSTKDEFIFDIGQTFQETSFPPASIFSVLEDEESITIQPIKTLDHDWGFILLIGTLNERNKTVNYHYDTLAHSIDLLAYALERKKSEEKIRYIAYHDALTGLYNRRFFYDRISEELEKKDSAFAVILLDLDRFKIINDSLGHSTGDKLLQHIAQLLSDQTGPNDIVARLGGDEFIVLCPALESEQKAVESADRILQALNEQHLVEGHSVYVTSSIGISFYPQHGVDRETLIKKADIAMYEAKKNGKNRLMTYHDLMNANPLQRLTMESALHEAINAEQFIVYYQPQFDVSSQHISGMEALIRWDSPVFGMIYPDDFISIAEETGIINSIDEWMLRQACQDTMKLLNEELPPLIVSVNISALLFNKKDFSSMVIRILQETGLPAHLLCLEITERVAIHDLDLTIRHLKKLMALGVRIALDDFGIGNSSLSLLQTLPLHMIKIDRSFVKGITQSEDHLSIFNSILGLAKGLRLESCAEGIETLDQFNLVNGQICSSMQGFFICKPLPLEGFKYFIKQHNS
jgi:diguanylate cyclase (GGDEF)-like protein